MPISGENQYFRAIREAQLQLGKDRNWERKQRIGIGKNWEQVGKGGLHLE